MGGGGDTSNVLYSRSTLSNFFFFLEGADHQARFDFKNYGIKTMS